MRSPRRFMYVVAISLLSALGLSPRLHGAPEKSDPLASWNDGTVKASILKFVNEVTDPQNQHFVPASERIATFDNDGTLWQEKPAVQGMFVLDKLGLMTSHDPKFAETEIVRQALREGERFFDDVSKKSLLKMLILTHSEMSQDKFDEDVRKFLAKARHPRLGKLYTELTYRPMLELVTYLEQHDFKVFLCSGGGTDFMRVFSESLYGIPREQVIGSTVGKVVRTKNGKSELWRLPVITRINDRAIKPLSIDLHTGARPLFAAGNAGAKGDIEMLSYSRGRPGPSFQLLINHDDAEREFSYSEWDGASQAAAAKQGWQVVSMKADWRVVFPE